MTETLNAQITAATETRVQALQKSFGDNRVLNGMELKIEKGEKVAVVGRSGCGKTVLLNHILELMTPDSGHVWVADNEIDGAPLVDVTQFEDAIVIARIHTHWGVVFQRNALFPGSVFEILALWLREVRNLKSDAITKIARALSMNPAVLFYNEPSTGLDPVSAAEIQGLILAMHQDGQ